MSKPVPFAIVLQWHHADPQKCAPGHQSALFSKAGFAGDYADSIPVGWYSALWATPAAGSAFADAIDWVDDNIQGAFESERVKRTGKHGEQILALALLAVQRAVLILPAELALPEGLIDLGYSCTLVHVSGIETVEAEHGHSMEDTAFFDPASK